MLLSADLLSWLGFAVLVLGVIVRQVSGRDDALICLAVCAALWFGADALIGTWFCLLDLVILTYALSERFPEAGE
jgi:hypothetical protein